MPLDSERTEASFSPNLTHLLYVKLSQVPRSPDIWSFLCSQRWQRWYAWLLYPLCMHAGQKVSTNTAVHVTLVTHTFRWPVMLGSFYAHAILIIAINSYLCVQKYSLILIRENYMHSTNAHTLLLRRKRLWYTHIICSPFGVQNIMWLSWQYSSRAGSGNKTNICPLF